MTRRTVVEREAARLCGGLHLCESDRYHVTEAMRRVERATLARVRKAIRGYPPLTLKEALACVRPERKR